MRFSSKTAPVVWPRLDPGICPDRAFLQRPRTRRGKIIVGPLFFGGLSPAGTFLGEDSRLQRRMGLDRDLRNGTLTLGRSVEQTWLRERLYRFQFRAYSGRVHLADVCLQPKPGLGGGPIVPRLLLCQVIIRPRSIIEPCLCPSRETP
jgi:hypothetical protein